MICRYIQSVQTTMFCLTYWVRVPWVLQSFGVTLEAHRPCLMARRSHAPSTTTNSIPFALAQLSDRLFYVAVVQFLVKEIVLTVAKVALKTLVTVERSVLPEAVSKVARPRINVHLSPVWDILQLVYKTGKRVITAGWLPRQSSRDARKTPLKRSFTPSRW